MARKLSYRGTEEAMTQQLGFFSTRSRETDVLVNRIKDGHTKIWERWQLIQQMPEGSGKDKYLDSWDNAVERLRGLANDLAKQGYRECICKETTPDYPCLVCTVPNELWEREGCPAWKLEE